MKSSIILFFILLCFSGITQVNVYDIEPITDVTNQQLNNDNLNPITGDKLLFDVNPSYNYSHGINKEIKGNYSIEIKDASYFKPSGNGSIHFQIDQGNKGVYCFSHNQLTQVRAYDKFELGVDLPADIEESINQFFVTEDSVNYLNPFMQWDVQLKCAFQHVGSGFVKNVDGFYSLDYERVPASNPDNWTWAELNTPNPFRIRVAFPEKYGKWIATIELWVNGQLNTSYSPFGINVVSNPDNKGFVKVGANQRTFDLGTDLFLPIGQNLISPEDSGCTWGYKACSSFYHQQFKAQIDSFAANGTNTFRMLLNPASLDIEFEKIGNYRERLNNAWEIDQIVKEAEATGLYIDLNMQFQYSFMEGSPYEMFHWDWSSDTIEGYDPTYTGWMNCYGKDLNLPHPASFLSDARCKKFYKQKLRYLLNRYGYSTNIYLMELISEINSAGDIFDTHWDTGVPHTNDKDKHAKIYAPYDSLNLNHMQNTYLWQKEMAEYIKHGLGYTEHLLSCSYAAAPRADDPTFGITELDVISYNRYPNEVVDFMRYFVPEITAYWNQYHKPIVFSETGPMGQYYCDNDISYKQNLWQLAFSGLAGFMFWDGDKYKYHKAEKIYVNNVYDHTDTYNIDNRHLWQEMRKLKNWILSDPDMVYVLQNDFEAVHVHSYPFSFNHYAKEMNFIHGHTLFGDDKLFGALNNLTDNYYTNATVASSWCLVAGDPSVTSNPFSVIPSELVPLTQKENMDYLNHPLSNVVLPPQTNFWFDWYELQGMSVVLHNFYDPDNYPNVIYHPNSCLIGACLNNEPYKSILPFRTTASNYYGMALKPDTPSLNNNSLKDVAGDANIQFNEQDLGLLVQPNPGNDEIKIVTLGDAPEGSEYRLYDLSGRLLLKEKASTEPTFMTIHTLLTGVYFIQLCNGEQILKITTWVKSE